MNNVEYGENTFKELKVVGDKMLIKKLKTDDLRCEGGIFIPESAKNKNEKIGVGKVLEITDETSKKYGIMKDDYVLYDYYSAHGDWRECIITNAENILLDLTESEAFDFLNGSLKI